MTDNFALVLPFPPKAAGLLPPKITLYSKLPSGYLFFMSVFMICTPFITIYSSNLYVYLL